METHYCTHPRLPLPSLSLSLALSRTLSLSLSLALCFNGHFPGGLGLAITSMSQFWILLDLKMLEVVVTTGAIMYIESSIAGRQKQHPTCIKYRFSNLQRFPRRHFRDLCWPWKTGQLNNSPGAKILYTEKSASKQFLT